MSLYSHSGHSKFSMPWSHWPTSSPVMVSSPPHKQQVTSCQSLQVALISVVVILFFIMFLSLTGNSLSEKAEKVNHKSHFISLFLFFIFMLFGHGWHASCVGEGVFYLFKVVSAWLSRTYDPRAGPPGPKCLVLSDLQHRILKKLY